MSVSGEDPSWLTDGHLLTMFSHGGGEGGTQRPGREKETGGGRDRAEERMSEVERGRGEKETGEREGEREGGTEREED